MLDFKYKVQYLLYYSSKNFSSFTFICAWHLDKRLSSDALKVVKT